MKLYQNIMEEIVEETYIDMKDQLNCCTCERCHADIIAWALNHLPAQYAVSPEGVSISKVKNLRHQHMADIQAALIHGAQVVAEQPRHSIEELFAAKK